MTPCPDRQTPYRQLPRGAAYCEALDHVRRSTPSRSFAQVPAFSTCRSLIKEPQDAALGSNQTCRILARRRRKLAFERPQKLTFVPAADQKERVSGLVQHHRGQRQPQRRRGRRLDCRHPRLLLLERG